MKQLNSRINGLKKIASNSTFNTRLMVANGVIMSKLVYLITVWGGAQQYLVKALQVQQLTADRTVCGFYSRGWSKKKLLDKYKAADLLPHSSPGTQDNPLWQASCPALVHFYRTSL